MGQLQNTNGPEPKEGKHHISQPLKDRRGVNFKAGSGMVQSPKATGEGKAKGNPGKPT